MSDPRLTHVEQFNHEIVTPLKDAFVGKDEIVDLMAVALVGGENLFLFGPPGTAKSALVRELALRMKGRSFDYLLTRFSEPNELFGPFDIRKLREGDLVTNTEGMLPEADFVFLDELLNANSAVLNSLLMVLNERVFRRGRENRKLDTLMVVGASNHLPEDDALSALFDRFLLRVNCQNVPTEMLPEVLGAGWKLDHQTENRGGAISVDDVRVLQSLIRDVDLSGIQSCYVELIHRLRHAGISVSDRRAVRLQRVIAASAVLCGRLNAVASDLWVLRYLLDIYRPPTGCCLASGYRSVLPLHAGRRLNRQLPGCVCSRWQKVVYQAMFGRQLFLRGRLRPQFWSTLKIGNRTPTQRLRFGWNSSALRRRPTDEFWYAGRRYPRCRERGLSSSSRLRFLLADDGCRTLTPLLFEACLAEVTRWFCGNQQTRGN